MMAGKPFAVSRYEKVSDSILLLWFGGVAGCHCVRQFADVLATTNSSSDAAPNKQFRFVGGKDRGGVFGCDGAKCGGGKFGAADLRGDKFRQPG